MKLQKIYLFIALLLCGSIALSAQTKVEYGKQNTNVNVEKLKNSSGKIEKLRVTMEMDLEGLKLKGQQMLVITPQIQSSDMTKSAFLPQVILAGDTRLKVLKRQIKFDNMPKAFSAQSKVYRAKDFRTKGVIKYVTEINYADWMNKAALGLVQTIEGCASCIAPTSIGFVPLYAIKTDPYTPSFASSYVAPEVEAVKERAESLEAFFNYKLARYELLKDYKGNKAELQRVDKFVRALREDKDLTVSDYTIVGYASPEGNFASNLTLSDNRAKTFASYLKEEYNVLNSKMKVSGKGEDWEGLKKAVAKSEIGAKNQIIDIITKTSDVYSRKAKLENLNGGSTYSYLLANLYPPLRRNTLTVSFVVKGFSLDEALKVYRTHPNRLSLEEFYRISELFTKGGDDFIGVFRTALKYFPDSEIALLNTAAALIDAKQFIDAKVLLDKAGDSAEVLSNLGIVAFNEGDVDTAKSYFEQALKKGSIAAKANLKELQKYIESVR